MQFGLIGRNIAYSLSPIMHNTHFKVQNDLAEYHLIDKPLDLISDQLKLLNGFNVTVPYKEAIISYCDELSDAVKVIGACNTVVNKNGLLYAYNTDTYGFFELLKKNHLDKLSNDTKVLIIGSGGAAKAVLYVFNHWLNYHVMMTNRTLHKAIDLMGNQLNTIPICDVSQQLDAFDIVINTTNVGVHDYASPIVLSTIKENSVYIDVNYQKHLKFLDDAKQKGAKTIDGQTMLIYQAAKAYEIWLNKPANIEAIYDVFHRKEIEHAKR